MKTYRIKITLIGKSRVVNAYKTVTVTNSDELRGEIENYCMELENKYSNSMQCEPVEEIEEMKEGKIYG